MPERSTYAKAEWIEAVTQTIFKNYKYLITKYLEITGTGKSHFENATFQELFAGAQKRYNLYGKVVRHTLDALDDLLDERQYDVELWKLFKQRYAELTGKRMDKFISETFFNSITRKVFGTVGFNPEIEFIDFSDFKEKAKRESSVTEKIREGKFSIDLIKQILSYYNWSIPYRNIEEDAQKIFDTIVPHLVFHRNGLNIECVEILKMAFYRNRGAFIIGRLRDGSWQMPFIIPILHDSSKKLYVDTVIYNSNDVSIVFSFTRASFFAHTTKPVELINFLKELMTHKSLGELYDSIGYYRHGKTILYRDLYRYINNHNDQFIIAPGIKGMVMTVFTMRHFNFVFKIIKDSFDNPKKVTRDQVIQKYKDVELNDRVGRLIYAHKFEHLEFNKADFTEELLIELKTVAKDSVDIMENKVIIKHLYIERRLDPLNLYLKHATKVEAISALIDYGHAIKDMAKANIFPGDLLLKNFGVTRHGRVIFYDYDEIQKVTEVQFRRIPPPRDEFDEFSAEPRFSVGVNDIFPEEWKNFMVPKGAIREVFMEEHADLFDAKYWRSLQKDIEQGEMLEFFAYDEKKRFEQEG
ncbi:MAG: bifunctional isocitrate dehydrogenase kinase/phosphatase [Bacteroidetes bacterium]|nr:bifunctional isocitrate dehydrogenase kinase/phosphatase [Bacteroidota bacterium]